MRPASYRIYRLNAERHGGHGAQAPDSMLRTRRHSPRPDIMLAQKIDLDLFDDDVLAIANMVLVDPRLGLSARGHATWR